jgi:hypothetical protein
MKQKNIIRAIKALALASAANKGFTGSESIQEIANEKIKLLIPLIKTEHEQKH